MLKIWWDIEYYNVLMRILAILKISMDTLKINPKI